MKQENIYSITVSPCIVSQVDIFFKDIYIFFLTLKNEICIVCYIIFYGADFLFAEISVSGFYTDHEISYHFYI